MNTNEPEAVYTLKQVSKKIGVPTYTLRRLCNAGVVSGIRRNRNGYRILSAKQAESLYVMAGLLNAGFTMRDLKKFARVRGANAIIERKAMLATQKRQLWSQLVKVQSDIDFIERQEELLDEVQKPLHYVKVLWSVHLCKKDIKP